MSVRRLAKEQPASFAFTPESMEQVNFWLAKYPPAKKQSASIPLLWLAQKQEGWVCEPAIRLVARMLEVPVIRILEVAFNNIMRSDRHASGFALRFPRIVRLRDDKPVEEIDTLERVEEVYQSQPDRPEENSE